MSTGAPQYSPTEQHARDALKEELSNIDEKMTTDKEEYDRAVAILGEGSLPKDVQALVDKVLEYNTQMGPSGAIWILAKAQEKALVLVAPQAIVDTHERLVKRRKHINALLDEHARDSVMGEAQKLGLIDQTGRPLQ